MKFMRVGMMLAALVWSVINVHAQSPSAGPPQPMKTSNSDQAYRQWLWVFGGNDETCPSAPSCPLMNGSTCWFSPGVRQVLTAWQGLRSMCAADGDCCKDGAACKPPAHRTASCVTGAGGCAKTCGADESIGNVVVLTLDHPIAKMSDLANCKVIKIEFQGASPPSQMSGGTTSSNGLVGGIVVRSQVMAAPAGCCNEKDCPSGASSQQKKTAAGCAKDGITETFEYQVPPVDFTVPNYPRLEDGGFYMGGWLGRTLSAACCCEKDCGCCETCKQKKAASVNQAPCCPLMGCQKANEKAPSCCEPAVPMVQNHWAMPFPPPPTFVPMRHPAPPVPYAVPTNGPIMPPACPIRFVECSSSGVPTVVAVPAVNAYPTVKRAHLVTPDMEADCERMTHYGDMVVLEGDVRLKSIKNGSPMHIEAQRLLINMKTGSFTVESDAGNARPSTFGVMHAPAFPQRLPVTTGVRPVSSYQPPTYRLIEVEEVLGPDIFLDYCLFIDR